MAENARTIRSPVRFLMRFYVRLNASSSASTFHISGAFSSFVPAQFNASFATLSYYLFYFARVQFISYFSQGIAVIIPVLTTFLQLKYQNKSPFATHPKAMIVAVSSSLVYYLAYIALLRYHLRRFAVVAHHCLVSSGFASVASLASVLLPDSFSPFVYAVFVMLSASDLLYWLYHKLKAEDDAEFQDQRRRVRRFLNNIWVVVGNSSEQWPQRLPI